jgi:hypothetical protein
MFEDFRKQEIYLDIFSFPFSFDVDRVPLSLQMELIELQENSKLKIKFKDTLLLEFYQKYFQKQKYPQLSAVSRIVLAQFGSTYCCEQFFSRMNFVKSKTRTRFRYLHLGNTLRVATSNFSPNLYRLVKDMHSQISH